MGTILEEDYKIIESIKIMQTFVQNELIVTALLKKYSNMEFFWSLFSRIQWISVSIPNVGKYGPEKT